MSKQSAFSQIAHILRNDGHTVTVCRETKTAPSAILILGRGRYEITTQSDRCYCWVNVDTSKLSEGFLADIYLADDEGIDEIADALIHLLEDE